MARIALYLAGWLAISSSGRAAPAGSEEKQPQPIVLTLPGSNVTMTFVPVVLFSEDQVLPKQAEKLTNIRSFETKDGGSYYYHYYLAKTEVTCEQWDAMACLHGAENEAREAEEAKRKAEAGETDVQQDALDEPNMPKRNVSPDVIEPIVKAYNALVRKDPPKLPKNFPPGGEIGLPTSDEWEFAARGGKVVKPDDFNELLPYPLVDLDRYEVLCPPSVTEIQKPFLVMKKLESALGLYDMLGNVQEVVVDKIEKDGVHFALKGGCFWTQPDQLAPHLRQKIEIEKNHSGSDAGFRLALTRPNDDRVRHRLLLGDSKVQCEWVRYKDGDKERGFWMSTDEMSDAPPPPVKPQTGKEGPFKQLTGLICRYPTAHEWLEASKILDLDGNHGEYVKDGTEVKVIGRAKLDWSPESEDWMNLEFSGWRKPLREKDRLAKTSAKPRSIPVEVLYAICLNLHIEDPDFMAFSAALKKGEREELRNLLLLAQGRFPQDFDNVEKRAQAMREELAKAGRVKKEKEEFRYRWVIDPP